MQVASLYRYPVKGLSPEPLDRVDLRPGEYVPGDRLFAIENGVSGFDPRRPVHQPKIKFLQLMRNERLARLRTRFDEERGTLAIRDGAESLDADVATRDGREAVAAFFRALMPDELRGEPAMLRAPAGFRFTDSRSGFVSLVGLASVARIAELVGRAVDPLRFRSNLYVEGLEPFAELDLVGTRLRAPSGAVLEITKRTVRCAAVNVDPTFGLRDMDLPKLLLREFGHMDCGVYATVVTGGTVRAGDLLETAPP